MSTLSVTKGKTLCKIKGGKLNNQIIYLYDSDFRCCPECKPICVKKKCCSKCSIFTYHFADNALQIEDDTVVKSIVLRGETFQQIPSNQPFNSPDLLYVSGRRGSGKSFYIANYLPEFVKCYPKYRIYLFSCKLKDDLLDKFITKRIDITQVKDASFKAIDFEKSLVLFDDVDSILDEKDKQAVYDVMTDIIETGRSLGIFCIVTSHLAANNTESKRILNGCTSFTFFLNSSSHQTEYVLKTYFGFSTKQIGKLIQIEDSRWVTVYRDCPQIVMTSNKIMFQSELMDVL